jgi:uncharacterized membrane protein YeaQ/YmgE (transglycosylase-associated protein family)
MVTVLKIAESVDRINKCIFVCAILASLTNSRGLASDTLQKIRGLSNFEQSNNDRKTSVQRIGSSTLSGGHGLWRLEMFYSIWLLAAALAGWSAGKIIGGHGFGSGTDILLGLTGAFVVRWSFENIGVPLDISYLLLFSIWGAGALPAALRFGIRLHNRSRNRSRLQSD